MSGLYRNILVAYDGSRDSDRALEHASALARDQNARLTVLVVVPPTSGLAAMAAVPESPEEIYQAILGEAMEKLPQDVGVTTRLLEGPPAKRIVDQIREGDYDLVVMGSRGRGRLAGALLGSVSTQVLHDSPVPVLIAHAPRHATD